MKISNYDQFEYDYSTYWKSRNYEHFAEVIALKKLFKNEKGNWFLDVGGSYGRHLPSYSQLFKHNVIIDYSLNTLINNKERITTKFPNTTLIAANAYFLPFKKNVFDGAMMVRVLHHIQEPKVYLKELAYSLKNNSFYIQEFANKIHIKATIKHILKGDFKFFNPKPFQQPSQGSLEGSNGEQSVFLNYHPKDINNMLSSFGFKKDLQLGTSFFRIPFLKKIFPFKVLISFERVFQTFFSWTNSSPSIFYKLQTVKTKSKSTSFDKIEEILVCPKCKSELSFKKEECICNSCKRRFEKVVDIWDFRIQE